MELRLIERHLKSIESTLIHVTCDIDNRRKLLYYLALRIDTCELLMKTWQESQRSHCDKDRVVFHRPIGVTWLRSENRTRHDRHGLRNHILRGFTLLSQSSCFCARGRSQESRHFVLGNSKRRHTMLEHHIDNLAKGSTN